jgi:NTP pyrophosphatase (non-canonical NTP hydrolase)
MQNQQIKFNKTFEALYTISMAMADACIVNKPLDARFEKLEEEFNEVIQAFAGFKQMVPVRVLQNIPTYDARECAEHEEQIAGELSDLMFVLLHIAHKLGPGYTAFDLLHKAASKMLSRMNDAEYIAKN